jgi:hypothetical protein
LEISELLFGIKRKKGVKMRIQMGIVHHR